MKNSQTKVRIIKQGDTQSLDDYEKQLQNHLNSINAQENVYGGAMCFPTSNSAGTLTTMIQWVEDDREKPDWLKDNEEDDDKSQQQSKS